MKRSILTIVATATALLAVPAAAETRWDMPTAYGPNNFHTVNIQKFADGVKEASGGKLVITVHNGASLFKAPEIKRAVETGQAQIGEILMVLLANENPIYEVDGLPFIATSYQAAKKLADVQRPYVEKQLDARGMKLLFAVPWPPQGLHVNKEVNTAKDLENLSMRAYSKQTSRISELLKARPVTIQAAEVTQALATGKVNSFLASAQSGVDYKVWESLKYFYDVSGWLPKNMVIVNKAAFDALDKDTQSAVLAEARKAEEAGWAASAETAEATKKTLADNGSKVMAPSGALIQDLSEIGKVMLTEWTKTAGDDAVTLIERFQK